MTSHYEEHFFRVGSRRSSSGKSRKSRKKTRTLFRTKMDRNLPASVKLKVKVQAMLVSEAIWMLR